MDTIKSIVNDIRRAWKLIVILIGFIVTVIELQDNLKLIIQNNPSVTIWVLFVTSLGWLMYVSSLFNKCHNYFKAIKRCSWKHPVLIIDDDPVFLKRISDYLLEKIDMNRIDLVAINGIPDYRLAESFEVIISDIVKAGARKGESIAALNAIKNAYPYKCVLAMSTNTSKDFGKGLKIDGNIIPKTESYENIKDSILKALDNLEEIENHWKKTEAYLIDAHRSDKEIAQKKRKYYHYIQEKIRFNNEEEG